jgi:hypothetical protein
MSHFFQNERTVTLDSCTTECRVSFKICIRTKKRYQNKDDWGGFTYPSVSISFLWCTYSLYCWHHGLGWQPLGQQWILIPYNTHPPGVRAMALLIGSVQGTLFGYWLLCLFSCTFSAPLVTRGLKAAKLPPTSWVCPYLPFLSFSLRFCSLFALFLDCHGSRQLGRTQGVGSGSIWFS